MPLTFVFQCRKMSSCCYKVMLRQDFSAIFPVFVVDMYHLSSQASSQRNKEKKSYNHTFCFWTRCTVSTAMTGCGSNWLQHIIIRSIFDQRRTFPLWLKHSSKSMLIIETETCWPNTSLKCLWHICQPLNCTGTTLRHLWRTFPLTFCIIWLWPSYIVPVNYSWVSV